MRITDPRSDATTHTNANTDALRSRRELPHADSLRCHPQLPDAIANSDGDAALRSGYKQLSYADATVHRSELPDANAMYLCSMRYTHSDAVRSRGLQYPNPNTSRIGAMRR